MIQPKNTNEPTLENALYSALDSRTGDEEKWRALRESGATDEVLTAAIRSAFGISSGSEVYGGYECKGGKSPQFIWFDNGPRHKAQKLNGKRLLAKVREKGIELDAPPKSSSYDHKKDQAAQRKKLEIRKEVAREALGFVSEKAADWIRDSSKAAQDEMMRLILNTICGDTWSDVVKLVARRRGVTPDPKRSHALSGLIADMDAAETIGLLTELALARQMLGWSTGGYVSDLGPRAKELLKFFDFDHKAAEKRIAKERAAAKKAKPKAKAVAGA